jgi:hypothetical protein
MLTDFQSDHQPISAQSSNMTSLIAELPKPGLKAQEQRRKAMEELMQRSRLNISSDWKWTLSEHDRIGYSNFSVFREVNPFNKREMWAVKRVEKYKAGFGQSKDWILREISSAALLTQEKVTSLYHGVQVEVLNLNRAHIS